MYLSFVSEIVFTTTYSVSSRNNGSEISLGSIMKTSPFENISSLTFTFPLTMNVISVAIL